MLYFTVDITFPYRLSASKYIFKKINKLYSLKKEKVDIVFVQIPR